MRRATSNTPTCRAREARVVRSPSRPTWFPAWIRRRCAPSHVPSTSDPRHAPAPTSRRAWCADRRSRCRPTREALRGGSKAARHPIARTSPARPTIRHPSSRHPHRRLLRPFGQSPGDETFVSVRNSPSGDPMKLYYHPISTTSRPIVLFASEAGIEMEYEMVDLFTGAQYKPEYTAINPSQQVPVLHDGDFQLTESSAILKYLADKVGSPAYPTDLRKRARVNERMDWFNTGFYRDFSYGFLYPQIFPFMRRADDVVQAGTLAYGKEKALGWLAILDQSLIGPRNGFVCGDSITIADYLGAMMVLGGEVIACNYGAYRNVTRWLDNMKALKHWNSVNEAFYQYVVEPNKGKSFVSL